ncbi:MAG: 3-hydroxyacyl-ACP dehydratase FabZ [Capsulimonas sp.]|uniref:3-hydroxyacyl-ACP dehydratase FabZ n=1 Tax=Capsulimonas sp. TaxID=2494211 RepID=UPI003263DB8A
MLDIAAIKEILPHRYPFLLVDRVLELDPGKRAVGIKNVTVNEEFFQGHFPQRPIMPGVLVIEAMAQIGGIMILAVEEHRGKLAFLGTIDNAKFRRPIVPGDTLNIEVVLIRARGNTGKVHCTARVEDQVVAEAEIMFVLSKPE